MTSDRLSELHLTFRSYHLWMFRIFTCQLVRCTNHCDMEHVIQPPSKVPVSVWTDNNLKYIDSQGPHKIFILSRVLDHIMDWKIDGTIRMKTAVASA